MTHRQQRADGRWKGGNDAAAVRPAGFGSIPYPSGVTFRVWAPNATAVTVYRPAAQNQPESLLGDLAAESNGCWSADSAGCSRAMSTLPGSRARRGSSVGLTRALGRSPTPSATSSSTIRTGFALDRYRLSDPGWDELVIYELHVGTFNELPGDTVGTLADAAQKLPYLARLGVSAVELLPLAEFATDTSWGYNPGVPYAVESAYAGAIGPDALKAFVQAAQ